MENAETFETRCPAEGCPAERYPIFDKDCVVNRDRVYRLEAQRKIRDLRRSMNVIEIINCSMADMMDIEDPAVKFTLFTAIVKIGCRAVLKFAEQALNEDTENDNFTEDECAQLVNLRTDLSSELRQIATTTSEFMGELDSCIRAKQTTF